MTSDFPTGFDPTRSILFLGSGFSVEATNISNKNPPAGDGLRKQILKDIGDPDSEEGLKDVAYHAARSGYDLLAKLRNTFTIKSLSANQELILSQAWRRIYTTNYDDTVEAFHKAMRTKPAPPSFYQDSPRPGKIKPGSIIHLHGYIHACSKDNLLQQLVLDHRSYAEQAVKDSPWWEQFDRDLRGASHIFFVGYSLSDFAAASYLTKTPALAKKTHFILRAPVNEYTRSRLTGYGSVHTIEVSGFAEECSKSCPGAPISELSQLQSFRLIDPNKDNKAPQRPTPVQIEALLTLGTFEFQRVASTYPRPEYVIPRRSKVTEALTKIDTFKSIIIHSRIANGKSVFASILAVELAGQGHTCIQYKSHTSINEEEISFLREIPKLCVFFESYDDLVNSKDEINRLADDSRIVVQVKTGTDQVRRSEVQTNVPAPIARVDINNLAEEDLSDFTKLLNDAGLPPKDVISDLDGGVEFRDLLLRLIESPHVAEKLNLSLRPVVENRRLFAVLLATCILKAFGIPTDPNFIRSAVKGDPYEVLFSARESASELLSFDADYLEPHSAIFSEFFIKKYAEPTEITAALYWLTAEAADRVNSDDDKKSQRMREARRALGGLMQYGNVSRLFPRNSSSRTPITSLYEALRKNVDINGEPLFWLQYSIFMQDILEFSLAEKHIKTAYDRARAIKGFRTYQLDTNYLGLLLKGDAIKRDPDACMENIIRLTQVTRDMIGDENHRVHAFKVLDMFPEFCSQNSKLVHPGYRQNLSILLFGVVQDLNGLPLEDKLEFSSDQTAKRIETAISLLSMS